MEAIKDFLYTILGITIAIGFQVISALIFIGSMYVAVKIIQWMV